MSTNDDSPVLGTELVFATPVLRYRIPEPEALNARLARYIRSLERADRSERQTTTVNRGWQSSRDFFEAEHPEVEALRARLEPAMGACLQALARLQEHTVSSKSFDFVYAGWAVIIRGGGFQDQHVHSRTDVVGVYCVETGSGEGAIGGELTLIDPRTGRLATRPYWERSVHSISPLPGQIVFMPSYVAHRVERYDGSGERITINLDLSIIGFGEEPLA